MIQRRKPLKRSSRPPRARKVDPTKRRFAKLRDPNYCAWVRTLPCGVADNWWTWMANPTRDCEGRVECAHVKARSTGGADRGNTLPLCRRHHRIQHSFGVQQFEYDYDIKMEQIALDLAARYTKENGE